MKTVVLWVSLLLAVVVAQDETPDDQDLDLDTLDLSTRLSDLEKSNARSKRLQEGIPELWHKLNETMKWLVKTNQNIHKLCAFAKSVHQEAKNAGRNVSWDIKGQLYSLYGMSKSLKKLKWKLEQKQDTYSEDQIKTFMAGQWTKFKEEAANGIKQRGEPQEKTTQDKITEDQVEKFVAGQWNKFKDGIANDFKQGEKTHEKTTQDKITEDQVEKFVAGQWNKFKDGVANDFKQGEKTHEKTTQDKITEDQVEKFVAGQWNKFKDGVANGFKQGEKTHEKTTQRPVVAKGGQEKKTFGSRFNNWFSSKRKSASSWVSNRYGATKNWFKKKFHGIEHNAEKKAEATEHEVARETADPAPTPTTVDTTADPAPDMTADPASKTENELKSNPAPKSDTADMTAHPATKTDTQELTPNPAPKPPTADENNEPDLESEKPAQGEAALTPDKVELFVSRELKTGRPDLVIEKTDKPTDGSTTDVKEVPSVARDPNTMNNEASTEDQTKSVDAELTIQVQ